MFLQQLVTRFRSADKATSPDEIENIRLSKPIGSQDSHGLGEREICYFTATKTGNGWDLDLITQSATFQMTFCGETEIDCRQIVARRPIANCPDETALSSIFAREVRALKNQGYAPETPHELDIVTLPPKNADLTAIPESDPNVVRTPQISAATGTNVIPMGAYRR